MNRHLLERRDRFRSHPLDGEPSCLEHLLQDRAIVLLAFDDEDTDRPAYLDAGEQRIVLLDAVAEQAHLGGYLLEACVPGDDVETHLVGPRDQGDRLARGVPVAIAELDHGIGGHRR